MAGHSVLSSRSSLRSMQCMGHSDYRQARVGTTEVHSIATPSVAAQFFGMRFDDLIKTWLVSPGYVNISVELINQSVPREAHGRTTPAHDDNSIIRDTLSVIKRKISPRFVFNSTRIIKIVRVQYMCTVIYLQRYVTVILQLYFTNSELNPWCLDKCCNYTFSE